jgi:hypothetical protein
LLLLLNRMGGRTYMKRSTLLLALALASMAIAPASADRGGRQVRFVGGHPIPKAAGGGYCHIEAPHVHVYMPADAKVQYRDHDGYLYFVGDPVAYGWDGPRHAYRGPHPIHVDVVLGEDGDDDVEYCYLDGPHFHSYEPPPVLAADFKVSGGAYWYVGEPAPAFVEARPAMVKINAIYTPIVYERPVVTVSAPPPGWIGLRFDVVTPGVVVEAARPAVVVERPRPAFGVSAGFEVHVPTPTLSVQVGAPAVYVGGGVVHRDVVYVEHERHGKWKHDNGRHRGWRKR